LPVYPAESVASVSAFSSQYVMPISRPDQCDHSIGGKDVRSHADDPEAGATDRCRALAAVPTSMITLQEER